MSEAIVELVNVAKDYASGAGIVRALRDVTLTINPPNSLNRP